MAEVKKTVGFIDVKNVLVTGAAKRLGRAIALDLAGAGWNVAIHYNGSAADAEAVAAEVARHGRARPRCCKPICRAEQETADAGARARPRRSGR